MRIFFFIISLVAFIQLNAQEPPVEIKKSTEKIIFDGKIYYLHVIQQGQTVYSISKAYNVPLPDIIQSNPGINVAQVSTGQVLKIPVKSEPEISESEIVPLEDEDFIYHEVKQGQTIYSLSKKYKVPAEIIYNYNPGTETGLKTGATIKIPKKKSFKRCD
ncbi:MAG: LysM peptidoglycan-binding domain-containing protein [Bacteroidales bacterium]|nr:LysM peptidoglycan-binding domain-containing protein [Bacteroidales bacterium]